MYINCFCETYTVAGVYFCVKCILLPTYNGEIS
jgi:hypothetical protein